MKRKKKKKPTSKKPILAAGGIVTRGKVRPLFAVVRLRRQKSWVLPKGKLNPNETAFAAARREAIEETARKLFAELGYERTSLRQVALQAGVDPALVSHFYGKKRDLFLAVVELPGKVPVGFTRGAVNVTLTPATGFPASSWTMA